MGDGGQAEKVAVLDRGFREAMRRRQQGDLDGAEVRLEALLDGYAAAGSIDRQARVRINLAQIRQMRGELSAAEAEYERAQALAESIDDGKRLGLCLGGLATIAMERGAQERCDALIDAALALFRDLEDPIGVGNQLGNRGMLRQQQGRLEEAVHCYTEAAKYFVGAGHAPGAVGVLQCIGELHRRQGEFDDAERAHRQALDLSGQVNNPIAAAHSHRAIGQILRLRGELGAAREAISTGLALHRKLGDVRGELAALIDLGTVEFALGRGSAAIEQLDSCIERARALDMPTPLTKALLNRALYRLDTDRLDEVSADLDAAHELLGALNDPVGQHVWTITRARVDIRRGDWSRAASALEQELERVEQENLAPSRAPLLGLLGSIALCQGETARALTCFEEAEANYRGLGDVEGARTAVLSRARILAEAGKTGQALVALGMLLETVRDASIPQPILEAELLLAQAGARELEGDFEAALRDARAAHALFVDSGFQLSENGAKLAACQVATNARRLAGTPLPHGHLDELRELLDRSLTFEAPTAEIMARCALADGLVAHGRSSEAVAAASDALRAARELSFPDGEARALEVLARAEENRAQALQACALWQVLDCVARAERVADEWALSQDERDGAVAKARDALFGQMA